MIRTKLHLSRRDGTPGPERRWRRPALIAGAAGALIYIGLVAAGPAVAIRVHTASAGLPAAGSASGGSPAAPSLGGWNISADGNAVDILVDNATGLAGIHPLSEADFPEAESQFQSGPFGSALATVFWPGSAGGNFGSLSGELGFPSQMQPLTSQMNDPVKASAQYPSGPASADFPAGGTPGVATMHSTAGAGGTAAVGNVSGEGQNGVFSFSSAEGQSSSVADTTARAEATSDVKDISIAGIIDISGVSSGADAKSDGNTGSGSAFTHVTGVTVLGQPASIGSDGLVLPDFAKALGPITGPVVQDAISQTISGLGLTVTEFPATEKAGGSGWTATSGALAVKIVPPSSAATLLEQAGAQLAPFFPSQAAIIPTLPGLLQGSNVTITLGRATASAAASPPFNMTFTPLAPPPTPPTGATPAGTGNPGSSAPVPSGPSPSPSAPSGPAAAPTGASSGATASAAGAPAAGAPLPPVTLVDLSKPLTAGIVVLGLAITAGLAAGLWRLARALLPADADPACPLGGDRS